METILLEEVYQGHCVKLESSKTIVGTIISDKVKLDEIVGPHVKLCIWIPKNAIYKYDVPIV
jgi:hypothetical protein